jgi:CRP-like cAMP-binding protein
LQIKAEKESYPWFQKFNGGEDGVMIDQETLIQPKVLYKRNQSIKNWRSVMATDAKMIRKFKCFDQLTDGQVEAIAEISNSICYTKGHTLFKEGDKGDLLYLLIHGDIEVFYETPEGLERVDTVSSEEVIGCSAMVPPHIYTATERALNDVEVLEIKTSELRELIKKDQQMGLKIQEHIMKILNDRILDLRHRAFPHEIA